MEPVTLVTLESFLRRLGERYPGSGAFYLLGGCALYLLGSPRTTVDIDYTVELDSGTVEQFEAVVTEVADAMRLDVDEVPLAEFIPLPPNARERRRPVGQYGQLQVYLFDLYSIALSKIARGFEADLEDVMFLLHGKLIEFEELERHFHAVLPEARKADIIPTEFREYFQEIARRYETIQ